MQNWCNELGQLTFVIYAAAFGLAWFFVGMLAGYRMRTEKKSGKKSGDKKKATGGKKRRSHKGVELYVGNIPYSMNEKELARTFEQHGKVNSARVIKNRFNGKSKGFGFVEMGSKAEAEEAAQALDGSDVKGRKVVVNEAKSKAKKDG
jgi:RNA recognition motif-containing protein